MTKPSDQMKTKASRYLKVTAVNALIGALVNIVVAWEKDWNWSVTMFLLNVGLFTIGGVISTYLLDTRRLPGPLLKLLDRLAAASREDGRQFMLTAIRDYPILVFGILGAIIWGSLAPDAGSLSAPARAIYDAALGVGTLWMVFLMVMAMARIGQVATLAVTFAEQMVLFALALVAVRAWGSELAELVVAVKANPDRALAVVAALIVLRIAFSLAPKRRDALARGYTGAGYAVMGLTKRRRTASDIHRTAVHEAGHLLLYACLTELPARLAVRVHAALSNEDEYRGHVQHSGRDPEVVTESFNHWVMLLYLAGAEAERLIFGERADGSNGDNEKWLHSATRYLTSGFAEVFYATPEGDAQIAHNRAVLNDLKAKCNAELACFLEANKGLLQELAAEIAERKGMDLAEIALYLKRVVGIDMMPRAVYSTESEERR